MLWYFGIYILVAVGVAIGIHPHIDTVSKTLVSAIFWPVLIIALITGKLAE